MLPPGPPGHYVVGSLLEYKGPKTNLQWTKQFGGIYSVNLAGKTLVYLNTIQLVERYMEGAAGELLLDRPPGPGAIGEGLLFGSGENWQKNKTATMRALHAATFVQAMEDVVHFELREVLQTLQAKLGQKVMVGDVLIGPCVNSIVGLLKGGSLAMDDPDRREVLLISQNLARCDLASLLQQISLKHPMLRLPLSFLFCTSIVNIPATAKRLHGLLRKWIRESRTETDPSDSSCRESAAPDASSASQERAPSAALTSSQWNFSRMSLNEENESTLQRILKQPEFVKVTEKTDTELIQSLTDFFFGGVTSTLSGAEFVLMYLSKNPDARRTAQKEIDAVAGNEDIRWSMKDQMPFLQACIAEALRLGCVTPSSLPHVALKETQIEGYIIPKGTTVMASIYSLHRDPEIFAEPEEFRPDRHLDSEGRFKQPHSYRPFGIGARRCVGEAMADIQLFLYTASILRQFDIEPADSRSAQDLETHMRIVHRLIDLQCVFTERKNNY
ncbi:cytochrome P450 2D15 [Biomphalaria glabrata]|nr:cytochrome P450 2D15 [Biomphalaria glabrata]